MGDWMRVPDKDVAQFISWNTAGEKRLTNCTIERTGLTSNMTFCDVSEHVNVTKVHFDPPGRIGGPWGIVVDDFKYVFDEEEDAKVLPELEQL